MFSRRKSSAPPVGIWPHRNSNALHVCGSYALVASCLGWDGREVVESTLQSLRNLVFLNAPGSARGQNREMMIRPSEQRPERFAASKTANR